ncbi:MAG: ABC transporter ATP-binding protein [Selenomonadaceae bacterium]|nr:ABC transporter ATP-binding protein [Selenomonadaceae bacterium]
MVKTGEIVLSHVSRQFTNAQGEVVQALKDISLTLEPGSFVSIIGPSGCGKSTLLRLVAGLDQPEEGNVYLDGEPIGKPGADRGFMFQEHNLFPWYSIEENISFGLKARNIYEENRDKVKEIMELVGLKGFEGYYPHQLSGGMCQRASLARALVGNPKVLLLDEPLGALDAFTRMHIQSEIERIWREQNMTMLMVTHDVEEAVYLSSTIIVMTARPGRVVKTIKVELPRPRDRSSKDFFAYSSEVLKLLHFGGQTQEPEYYL